jgi:hypothetical protein
MVDFMEDSDKEYSDSSNGDMSIATVVQQRQEKRFSPALPPSTYQMDFNP